MPITREEFNDNDRDVLVANQKINDLFQDTELEYSFVELQELLPDIKENVLRYSLLCNVIN